MFEKIMEFLKKIGMLQSGGETWSGDAKNRPASFNADDFELSKDKKKPAPPKK